MDRNFARTGSRGSVNIVPYSLVPDGEGNHDNTSRATPGQHHLLLSTPSTSGLRVHSLNHEADPDLPVAKNVAQHIVQNILQLPLLRNHGNGSQRLINYTVLGQLFPPKEDPRYLQPVFGIPGADILCLCRSLLKHRYLPTLSSVKYVLPPVKVFGDIHGQASDLLEFFAHYGAPCTGSGDILSHNYVFNGDFVDRGAHQLETLLILFSVKLLYGDRIHLNRGNHELREMNIYNGFHDECKLRYQANGKAIFEAVNKVFDHLPIATIIQSIKSDGRGHHEITPKILIVHGGIGPDFHSIQDLEHVSLPISDEESQPVVRDALWNDPAMNSRATGFSSSARGEGVFEFGCDVVDDFLTRNGIETIIRSHECVDQGYEFFHGGKVITVFSAKDYTGQCDNHSAFLQVTQDTQRGKLFVLPVVLPSRSKPVSIIKYLRNASPDLPKYKPHVVQLSVSIKTTEKPDPLVTNVSVPGERSSRSSDLGSSSQGSKGRNSRDESPPRSVAEILANPENRETLVGWSFISKQKLELDRFFKDNPQLLNAPFSCLNTLTGVDTSISHDLRITETQFDEILSRVASQYAGPSQGSFLFRAMCFRANDFMTFDEFRVGVGILVANHLAFCDGAAGSIKALFTYRMFKSVSGDWLSPSDFENMKNRVDYNLRTNLDLSAVMKKIRAKNRDRVSSVEFIEPLVKGLLPEFEGLFRIELHPNYRDESSTLN